MNTESLLRCAAFASLDAGELTMLLCCLDARFETLGNNRTRALCADEIAFVASGEVTVDTPYGSARAAARGDALPGRCLLTARTRCELLILRRSRLLSLCGNACACHRKALAGFARLSPQADAPPGRFI